SQTGSLRHESPPPPGQRRPRSTSVARPVGRRECRRCTEIMTTTDANGEQTSQSEQGSREGLDEKKLWEQIAVELLDRDYDTLEENLRESYQTLATDTVPRHQADARVAP